MMLGAGSPMAFSPNARGSPVAGRLGAESPLPKGIGGMSPMAADGYGEAKRFKRPVPGSLPDVNATYYGPAENPNAWSAWDCSRGQNVARISYTMFRNRRHGMAVELDEQSGGTFRFVPNDHDGTYHCAQNGLYHPCHGFGAGKMYHELRHKARAGGLRMANAKVKYGTWQAEVKREKVVITQTNTLNRAARLHIILLPECMYVLGETSSINSTAGSFMIDGKDPVPLSQDSRDEILNQISDEGPRQRVVRAKSSDSSRLMFGEDDVGILRRALTSVTPMQKRENEAAEQFLAMDAKVRAHAVCMVEEEYLLQQMRLGDISEEEYDRRLTAIREPAFPSRTLKAEGSLETSMFIDHHNKKHIHTTSFSAWDRLSWVEKLRVARVAQNKGSKFARQQQSAALQKQQSAAELMFLKRQSSSAQMSTSPAEGNQGRDPDLPKTLHNDQHYADLMRGVAAGGVQKYHREELSQKKKERQTLAGRKIPQIFEECEKCGRRCEEEGAGICQRCKAKEQELLAFGMTDETRAPDTYFGDSRALLGHPGFYEYIPAPLKKDQVIRNKIDERLATASTDHRRGTLAGFGELPVTPLPESAFVDPVEQARRNYDRKRREALVPDPREHENSIARFLQLVRNNRLEDVKKLLEHDLDQHGRAVSCDFHDRWGNNALLVASQQGYKKMTKLLVTAGSSLDHQNESGNTALHYCALYGFHSLFDYLSRKGADEHLVNGHGKTCFDMQYKAPG